MYTMQLAPWAYYLQLVRKWVGPMINVKGQISRVRNSWVLFTSILLFGHFSSPTNIPTCMSTLLLLMQ